MSDGRNRVAELEAQLQDAQKEIDRLRVVIFEYEKYGFDPYRRKPIISRVPTGRIKNGQPD